MGIILYPFLAVYYIAVVPNLFWGGACSGNNEGGEADEALLIH